MPICLTPHCFEYATHFSPLDTVPSPTACKTHATHNHSPSPLHKLSAKRFHPKDFTICSTPGCRSRARYNFSGLMSESKCRKHKEAGMIILFLGKKKCRMCSRHATVRTDERVPILCSDHRSSLHKYNSSGKLLPMYRKLSPIQVTQRLMKLQMINAHNRIISEWLPSIDIKPSDRDTDSPVSLGYQMFCDPVEYNASMFETVSIHSGEMSSSSSDSEEDE